jgi:hypothetical protein
VIGTDGVLLDPITRTLGGMEAPDLIQTVLVFAALMALALYWPKFRSRRVVILAAIGSVIFAAGEVLGAVASQDAPGKALIGMAPVLLAVKGVGLVVAGGLVLTAVFHWALAASRPRWPLTAYGAFGQDAEPYGSARPAWRPLAWCVNLWTAHPWRAVGLIFGVLVVSRVPYLLLTFPGVVTPDSQWQISQVLGVEQLSAHHPLLHTAMIWPFMQLGAAVGSLELGVVLYSVFSILTTCALFTWALVMAIRLRFGRVTVITIGVLALAFTVNGYYSVTMWKDTFFGPLMVCYTLCLIRLVRQISKPANLAGATGAAGASDSGLAAVQPGRAYRIKQWVAFILVSLGVTFMRNNGLYVVLIATVVLAVLLAGHRALVATAGVVCLVAALIVNGPVYKALDVTPGPVREALSIPLQQIARIANNHPDDLSASQKQFIETLLSSDTVAEAVGDYNPTISDPIKKKFNQQWYLDHKGEFWKQWLNLALEHPITAYTATAAGTRGYWVPEVRSWTVRYRIVDEETWVESRPALPDLANCLERNSFGNLRGFPLIGWFYSIGLACSLVLLGAGVLFLKRRYREMLALVPLAVLWLTCLASPVFAHFRYAYGIVLTAPLVIFYAFIAPLGEKRKRIPKPDPH